MFTNLDPIAVLGVIAILLFVIRAALIHRRKEKVHDIFEITDPDERLTALQRLFDEGYYKNRGYSYYASLSVCYYEKDDHEQALR